MPRSLFFLFLFLFLFLELFTLLDRSIHLFLDLALTFGFCLSPVQITDAIEDRLLQLPKHRRIVKRDNQRRKIMVLHNIKGRLPELSPKHPFRHEFDVTDAMYDPNVMFFLPEVPIVRPKQAYSLLPFFFSFSFSLSANISPFKITHQHNTTQIDENGAGASGW